MAARLLDRTLLERVGGTMIEMCGPSTFISLLSHVVRSGEAPAETGHCRSECEVVRYCEHSTPFVTSFCTPATPSSNLLSISIVVNQYLHGLKKCSRARFCAYRSSPWCNVVRVWFCVTKVLGLVPIKAMLIHHIRWFSLNEN